ncbi:MAG: T9SS type A sorting domain-containing protein [Calditrichaeota bacterium]|nr:T9SS type A sorting domain-containing protein [Calditrichota bacterium]
MSKFFTVAIIVLLAFGSIQARELAKVKKAGPAETEQLVQRLSEGHYVTPVLSPNRVAVELGRTFYDYATNNVTARQMAWAVDSQDGVDGIHFVFMKIFPAAGERYVNYDYYDLVNGLFYGNQPITTDARTGWGRVVNGTDDRALVSMHGGGTRLFYDQTEASGVFTSTVDGSTGSTFPGVSRIGDRIFFITNGSAGDYAVTDSILISDDNGATWTSGPGYSLQDIIDPLTVGTNSEMWPSLNPTDPNVVAMVHAPDITANAPTGEVVVAYGTIGTSGMTWTETGVVNDGEVYNTDKGATQYIVENFGQVNGFYTQDGTYHVVMGAVQGILDTLASSLIDNFPILYWNDNARSLIELTSDAADTPADTNTINNLAALRPGNGLGNSYPSLSEGPNGELFVVWNQWEDDGNGGLVSVTPAGGTEVFLTDIWGAFSADGGASWSEPVYIAGQSGVAESFPILNKNFIYENGEATIDVMYLEDTNPGVSLFAGGNDASECIWYYERVTLAVTGIGDGGNQVVASDFKLEQNYPNPFNPTTTISYEVSKAADVNLDVYNVLGEKVASLVSGRQNAGSYTVDFDAASFSSGIYFYTLTSGSVKITKKMVLMK